MRSRNYLLLAGPLPPHCGVTRSRLDDQTAAVKDTVACATAAAKVVNGNVVQSMASSSAVTNSMGLVALRWRGRNNPVVAATCVLFSYCRVNSVPHKTTSCRRGGHGSVCYCRPQMCPWHHPSHNGGQHRPAKLPWTSWLGGGEVATTSLTA